MPVISPEALRRIAIRALAAAGAPEDTAAQVADSLVEASLKGVDSHGVARIPRYVEQLRAGTIRAEGRPQIVKREEAFALIDGGGGFGMTAMDQASDLAIEMARSSRVAAVAVANCAHTGRIGRFAERIAAAGMFGLALGGGGHRDWPLVAPHGGARAAYATNPYAFALPGGKFGTVLADFATSVTAHGRISDARTKGVPIPEGWIQTAEGKPTTDPEDLPRGGSQLTMGAHKGYGMAIIAELLGDAWLGRPHEFNWLVIALDLTSVRPLAAYEQAAETYLGAVKDIPPAQGFSEVLLPGEPERRAALSRRNGIPVPDAIWADIKRGAMSVNVDAEALARD